MGNTILEIFLIMSIPSAVTGFAFWLIERKMQRREERAREMQRELRIQEEKRDEVREQNEFLILQSVNASIALSEATAKAVQRIPDANCNGDMTSALEYAEQIKHEQRDFLARQGIQNIYFDSKGGAS